ncbi:MAG: hypothetical protein ACJ8BW_00975 [Ktedonobacteraceae bacterium]
MHEVTHGCLVAVDKEMGRQDRKWGVQKHPEEYWLAIVMEELGEVARAIAEKDQKSVLFAEIQQCAAVMAQWLECLDGIIEAQ